MRVLTELTGTTPLLMHNPRLADPDDPITVELSRVTGKRKKTSDDRQAIADLEWLGGIYTDDGRIVVETVAVRKMFAESAKVTRQGKALERALVPLSMSEPLEYAGSRNIADLHHDPAFRIRKMAVVSNRRIQRTRPMFMPWSLQVEFELLSDVLSVEDFTIIVERAGITEGLLDGRRIGYGRCSALVKLA